MDQTRGPFRKLPSINLDDQKTNVEMMMDDYLF